jgi:hypothetical protein
VIEKNLGFNFCGGGIKREKKGEVKVSAKEIKKSINE